MIEVEYFKATHKQRVALLLPNVKYRHVLPSYLKWCGFLKERGHQVELVSDLKQLKRQPDVFLLSTVFTYYSKKYSKILDYYQKRYPSSEFFVGGIFATLMPEYFKQNHGITIGSGLSEELDAVDYDFSLFPEVDRVAIYTSRGCVNGCKFCCVPRVEGKMKCDASVYDKISRMLKAKPNLNGIVVFDNNFSCHDNFLGIVDELERLGLPVDFYGLDCDKMTEEKIKALSKLKFGSQADNGTDYIRFAFDKMFQKDGMEKTLRWCKDFGVKANYFAYCLYNFNDSPEQFYEKVRVADEIARRVGKPIFLFPQECEPLTALERHKYIDAGWTHEQLRGLRVLLTFIRGFLPVGYDSVFRWIGKDEKRFKDHIEKIGKGMKPCKVEG